MSMALANKLWPDLIMHPQPVSEVKPPCSVSWLRSRTEKLIEAFAFGSCDFGMAGKPERYENHSFDSKSSRNACGQPPSVCAALSLRMDVPSSSSDDLITSNVSWSTCFRFPPLASIGGGIVSRVLPSAVGGKAYSLPRHHTGRVESPLLVGSGSQKYCTIRLYRLRSTAAII